MSYSKNVIFFSKFLISFIINILKALYLDFVTFIKGKNITPSNRVVKINKKLNIRDLTNIKDTSSIVRPEDEKLDILYVLELKT